jgi:UDP-glucose-4-epimerase GalE
VGLLDAARAAGVERFVFSSTAAVYGVPDATPIPEDAPLRPINPYGESKRAFESALDWYGRAYGLRSVSLRYFNVAGATEAHGEVHEPETHLIPNVLRAVDGGPPLTVFGGDYPTADGTCIRDYIHVADLAEAHLLALEATASGDPRTDEPLAINLGNGGGFSVREVLGAAEAVTGRRVPHLMGPRRAGDPPVLVADASRASEILGWRPTRPGLDEMVGTAWAWRRNHSADYEG